MMRFKKQGQVTIDDLKEGVEFELDSDQHISNSSESDEEFNDEAYDMFKEEIVDTEGKNKPRFLGGTDTPFHVLKETMKPITEDGLVLKEVLRNGVGMVIPEKSVVMMHYDAYFEGKKEQFDSTRLRKRPYKFLLGDGNVLLGLELGVQSMKKEEVARFIVSAEYAYGSIGCPPRIPPNAEILFEVEIINFHQSKNVVEFEDMSSGEQKKAPFETIVGVYHCENQMANDLFRQKNYKPAIARYRRVMQLLEDVSVQNEKDDEKRQEYLLKLYLNLAQCYINAQNPKKGIIYADLALKLDPDNPKGLFRMGYALYLTNSFERGEYYLNRAKKHKPYEKNINAMIIKLEKKRKDYHDWERMFCKKMMGTNLNDAENKPIILQESPEFIAVIRDQMKEFVDSDEKELTFSPGYTESQLEVVEVLAKEFNLEFISKIHSDKRIIKVAKKKSNP